MTGSHIVRCNQCDPKLIKDFHSEGDAREWIDNHHKSMAIMNIGGKEHFPKYALKVTTQDRKVTG